MCAVASAPGVPRPSLADYVMGTGTTRGQPLPEGAKVGFPLANILGMTFSSFVAWFLWRGVYLVKLPRLAKKTRVALSWPLEMIFSKDLEQMLTLRDVELISRIATSLRNDVAK